ncbi:MAG: efflux RND transporter permease subunit [Candidatus Longimicrobiales bacterium M2_2A_002]
MAEREQDGAAGPERGASGGGLSGVAIRRPVFTTMVMMALVVLGIFSFRRLAIDQFPEIDIPIVVVQTLWPGASPETMEREVTRRLEEAFNPIQGVDRITSVSLEGVGQILIEFELDRKVEQAAQDVRAKIDAVRRQLPVDMEPPVVQTFDPSAQPILSMALSSDRLSPPALTRLADEDIRRRLEAVSGVGQVRISGGLAREVRVFLRPDAMDAAGVSTSEIMGALGQQNLEVPAGRLERGPREQLVRVTGRITDPAQFAEIIVANRNGQPVRLGQVARVEDATEEERSLAFVNGERAVAMDILKVSGANTVRVAEAVKEAVEEDVNPTLPAGVELQIVRDNSEDIRHMVEDVIFELMLGALLTVLVVMIFLNDWKATAITSLALPVSVISSFLMMNVMGFTLNMLTLMALSLSIGILIDDAIVVIENIVRHRELGENHFNAAKWGTREIFLAVLATTLSIVAVFVPVAFMGGIIGRFFFQFGLTVAFAVLVSLFVSFTLTPMLSAWWGVEPHQEARGIMRIVTKPIVAFNTWFERQAERYRGVIGWALRRRRTTVGIATASFIGAFALFPFIGGGFMPDADAGEFAVTFETPEGSSIQYTRRKAAEVVDVLRAMDGVDYTYTTIGAGATGTVTAGEIYVALLPRGERPPQDRLMVEARDRLRSIYGLRLAVLDAGGMGGTEQPIQVNVRGPDVAVLQRLSDRIADTMRAMPGVVDVQTSLGQPRPEYRIDVDRDVANELGLSIGQVSATVRPLLAGQTVTSWEDPTGEQRDVVVQVEPTQRRSLEDLLTLPVATAIREETGGAITVPLGQIARIEEGVAPSQIDRQSLERVATVSAGLMPELSVAEASGAIGGALAGMEMPPGYTTSFGGETEALEETVGYVIEALILAIILIFLILASQFESYTQPLAIMVSLPLSLIGVLLALLVTDDTLNMMSMIGVIMLMGLVTKNAILLVDNANEQRVRGRDRTSALIEAGRIRLRPIMMTTAAMIFGMLPIALGLGEGGGFRAPMARAVIGGLITSTLLTLIVVPVAYTYFDDFGTWVKRRFVSEEQDRKIHQEQEAAGMAPEPIWGGTATPG